MPQIPYLNSVRFPFFVPSEDCSCKIHGLRVGITKASGGLDIAGPQPASFFSSPCSLLLNGGRLLGNMEGEAHIHVSYRNIGLVQMHLCLVSGVWLPREGEQCSPELYVCFFYFFFFMNHSSSHTP